MKENVISFSVGLFSIIRVFSGFRGGCVSLEDVESLLGEDRVRKKVIEFVSFI